jgi:hypothetical protein
MAAATTISQAFRQGKLYSDGRIYKFIRLPTTAVTYAVDLLSKINKNNRNPGGGESSPASSPSLPSPAFQTMMFDKDEITLMICDDDWKRYGRSSMPETENEIEIGSIDYRMITFDVVLAPTLVGFMAVVTKALATAKISVLPFAAYSRDHIFVSALDYDNAITTLQGLATHEQQRES